MTQKNYFFICIFLLSSFIYVFKDVLFPFCFGFILAYLMHPIVVYLSKYKISIKHSSMLFTLLLIYIFVFIGLKLIPLIQVDVVEFLKDIPKYYEQILKILQHKQQVADNELIVKVINEILNAVPSYLGNNITNLTSSIISNIIHSGNTITTFFSSLIIIPISFYHFLKDWNKLTGAFSGWVPEKYKSIENSIYIVIRKSVRTYLKGQFYVACILFTYYYCVLLCLNVKYAFSFSVMSGILSFIPYLGSLFCFFVALIYCIICNSSGPALCTLTVLYFIGQIFEGYILAPNFIGQKVGLHPLWIFFAFFAGYAVAGIIGVCLGVPCALIVSNLGQFAYSKFHKSDLYKER